MIERIYNTPEISFSKSYYGRKIRSYAESYGYAYDFCRIYRLDDSGYILLNNSNCVIDGTPDDNEELEFFIRMHSPMGIELDRQALEKFAPEGYERQERFMIAMNKCCCKDNSSEDIVTNRGFEQIYRILSASFGETDHDLWYVDISHRVRHNTAMTLLYKNAAAAVIEFKDNDYAYISQVATLPEKRGQGLCRHLLGYISEYLLCQGITGHMLAYHDKALFYTHLGFEHINAEDDIYFTVKK
ncbi:MAG: GNAT family N-acetyltransferase [Oscillospiraceae bacterium]|nr:GNAT family N-acetyltransferase [Oscillospiraceae bacterium]